MAIIELDLENAEHLELTDAQWRFGEGLVPGEPNGGLVDRLAEVSARLADYDDSGWPVCENIQEIILSGLCFGWYRITVTIPEEVDGTFRSQVQRSGFIRVLTTTVKSGLMVRLIWLLGSLDGVPPRVSIRPQRVVVTESAEPGAKHVIACLAINGPLARPGGGIFLRFAKLEFELLN